MPNKTNTEVPVPVPDPDGKHGVDEPTPNEIQDESENQELKERYGRPSSPPR